MKKQPEKPKSWLNLPFENPDSWSEVAYNYEAMERQIIKHQEELAKRFPLERIKVANEIEPLMKELERIKIDLEKIEKKYFFGKDGEEKKVTELSKPGRAFAMMTVSSHLYIAIGELKKLLESLRIYF